MPHYPKPFLRESRNLWYVQVDGRQVNLGPDRDAAFRRYHDLKSDWTDIDSTAPSRSLAARVTVAEVLDRYLDWHGRQPDKAARTLTGTRSTSNRSSTRSTGRLSW